MTHIGQPRRRVEDRPLLLGAGRFTDDLRLPGTLHVSLVRSVHAHARVAAIDTTAARGAPGVVDVVTGADLAGVGSIGFNPTFPRMKVAPHPALVLGVVRAVGEPVAAVVAETAAQARDAADLVAVAYEPRPPLMAPEAAVTDGEILHAELGTNRAFSGMWKLGDVAAAFASPAAVARVRVEQSRVSAVAMEGRAVLATHDRPLDELTVWCSTQAPFRVRSELANALDFPESRIRVIAPDVGGGFGVKADPHREELLLAWLALRLGRPVKWIATRMEDLLTTRHGRGLHAEGELAVDPDGRIRGVRARILTPLGSTLMFNAAVCGLNHARLLPNAYVVPAFDVESVGVYTTTTPTGPYRGAGRPEGVFLMERLMDEAAATLGLDPVEIRRRNFVAPDAFPYKNAAGFTYDSGNYAAALDKALATAGYAGLRRAQAAARARGAIVGVGVSSYVENAALGWESGAVHVERTGAVTIVTGSSAHGQGHETTWAQIAADALGIDPAQIAVRHGDTRGAPQGFGTTGSRSTALGGSAVHRAAVEIREKGRRIAAHLMEAAAADVVLAEGGFHVAGLPER
ncbi:MAG: xanthine dehydrogenase family protein, partial [Candidatus Rokubacteria bacterium]|nr:xanthine dehydrogenase family protein [Candidatus Rokubacteria bacterium]